MSRVSKNPISLPSGVTVLVESQDVTIKGSKGALHFRLNALVLLTQEGGIVRIAPRDAANKLSDALAGTTRAVISNMVDGVSKGFERKLELLGVGYRAQVQGKKLNLTLGFSHPVAYDIPETITIETPSQTEIVVKGTDKQLVGLVAAKIRSYRPPEVYKGKGVRYAGEKIILKEVKKK